MKLIEYILNRISYQGKTIKYKLFDREAKFI